MSAGDDFLPPSLLEVRDKRPPRPPLSRVAVACSVDAAVVERVSNGLSQAVAAAQTQYEATGLALLQQGSLVVVVEVHHEAVEPFLRAFGEARASMGVSAARVVAASEDCPYRRFGRWSLFEVSVAGDAGIDAEDPSATAYAMYASLLQLGDLLESSGDDFSRVKRKHGHLLPTNALVAGLAKRDAFMPVDEYIEFHFEPLDLVLDSERVWPEPPQVAVVGSLSLRPEHSS